MGKLWAIGKFYSEILLFTAGKNYHEVVLIYLSYIWTIVTQVGLYVGRKKLKLFLKIGFQF